MAPRPEVATGVVQPRRLPAAVRQRQSTLGGLYHAAERPHVAARGSVQESMPPAPRRVLVDAQTRRRCPNRYAFEQTARIGAPQLDPFRVIDRRACEVAGCSRAGTASIPLPSGKPAPAHQWPMAAVGTVAASREPPLAQILQERAQVVDARHGKEMEGSTGAQPWLTRPSTLPGDRPRRRGGEYAPPAADLTIRWPPTPCELNATFRTPPYVRHWRGCLSSSGPHHPMAAADAGLAQLSGLRLTSATSGHPPGQAIRDALGCPPRAGDPPPRGSPARPGCPPCAGVSADVGMTPMRCRDRVSEGVARQRWGEHGQERCLRAGQ